MDKTWVVLCLKSSKNDVFVVQVNGCGNLQDRHLKNTHMFLFGAGLYLWPLARFHNRLTSDDALPHQTGHPSNEVNTRPTQGAPCPSISTPHTPPTRHSQLKKATKSVDSSHLSHPCHPLKGCARYCLVHQSIGCASQTITAEHYAPGILCSQNTKPPEHYAMRPEHCAPGTLSPRNTMPPEHYVPRARCSRGDHQ